MWHKWMTIIIWCLVHLFSPLQTSRSSPVTDCLLPLRSDRSSVAPTPLHGRLRMHLGSYICLAKANGSVESLWICRAYSHVHQDQIHCGFKTQGNMCWALVIGFHDKWIRLTQCIQTYFIPRGYPETQVIYLVMQCNWDIDACECLNLNLSMRKHTPHTPYPHTPTHTTQPTHTHTNTLYHE